MLVLGKTNGVCVVKGEHAITGKIRWTWIQIFDMPINGPIWFFLSSRISLLPFQLVKLLILYMELQVPSILVNCRELIRELQDPKIIQPSSTLQLGSPDYLIEKQKFQIRVPNHQEQEQYTNKLKLLKCIIHTQADLRRTSTGK